MLNNDVFIFDNAVHMYDLSDANIGRSDGQLDRAYHLHLAVERRPRDKRRHTATAIPSPRFACCWNEKDLGRLLFEDSSTDTAMVQSVVLYDVYKEGYAPVQAQYEFARAFPDRVLFCGGVDPLYPSLQGALEEMEHQVREMGARSFLSAENAES